MEEATWRVARFRFRELVNQRSDLINNILNLSQRYCSPSRSQSLSESTEGELLARLVFFSLADAPKIIFPLAELISRHQFPRGPLRILDVGAGCGSMSLGLLEMLASNPHICPDKLELDALDVSSSVLKIWSMVVNEWIKSLALPASINVSLLTQCLIQPVHLEKMYDLILLGNVINELPVNLHLPIIKQFLGHLSHHGQLIIIEPALCHTSRALHHLRDQLAQEKLADIFAPCTRKGFCPALKSSTDWCHECRTWLPPPELMKLANLTSLRRRDLKWSYLTLNRHGARIGSRDPAGDRTFRVVSELLTSKGKQEIFLCGEAGRIKATLLNRDRTAQNAAFKRLHRGMLINFDGSDPIQNDFRIKPELQLLTEEPALFDTNNLA